MADAGLPGDAAVGSVALAVEDGEAVADFYERVVGLERLEDGGVGTDDAETDDGELDHAERTDVEPGDSVLVLGAGGEPLLHLHETPDRPPRAGSQAGLYHVAFRVPDRTALGAAIERCRAGPGLDGAADHLASEAIYLSDPEGNGVEIYADRPRSEWAFTDEGVRLDSLPLDLDGIVAHSDGASAAPADTDVGHVHLAVTSMGPARSFYGDALGMNLRQAVDDTAAFLAAGDYHHHVGLNTWGRQYEPAGDTLGLAWFEVVVPDAAALEATVERLRAAGYDPETVEAGGAAHDAVWSVVDPDRIELRLRVE